MKRTTPLKQIRLYCIQCCADQPKEVELCPINDCPLWSYRFGHDPFRTKREYTEEQKAALRSRMENARKNKGTKE